MSAYKIYVNYIFHVLGSIKRDLRLTEETDLVAEAGLSSLQMMELIEKLEDHFDMSIPLNILPDINTISDLACQLERLTEGDIHKDAVR